MPSRTIFDFLELNTQQVLVDGEDGGDNNGDWEILFDKRVIEVESLFNELSVIVPIIPNIKLPVKGNTSFLMFLFLQCEEGFFVFQSDRSKFLLQIVKELRKGLASKVLKQM